MNLESSAHLIDLSLLQQMRLVLMNRFLSQLFNVSNLSRFDSFSMNRVNEG